MPVLKQRYNELLVRWNKAFKYLSNNSIPLVDRENWLSQYEDICAKLNSLVTLIRESEPVTNEELMLPLV